MAVFIVSGANTTAFLTTAMASNRGSDFVQATAAFAGTSASGTINSTGISVSIGPYITTAMASNRGTDFVQATAAFAGTSASGTIASGGISVSIGPYITTAMASNRGTDFMQATAAFAGTSASGTIASGGISVSIGPYLTTAMLSNAATLSNIKVSAGTLSANRSDITFSNSNGVSFGLETNGVITGTVQTNYLTTAALSGDTTKYVQAWELAGNTAGTTSSLQGTKLYFAGGNNITLSGNSNSITISAGAGAAGTAISGISQSQTMYTSGTVLFSEQANITINSSVNGASQYLRFSVAAPGGGAGNTISEWCPYPEMNVLSASALVLNSIYFNPVDVPENLNAYRANFFLSVGTTISASNNTKSGGYTLSMCLYSRGIGASTERLQTLLSRSAFISFTASSHTRIQIAHPAGIANSTSVSQSSTSGAATNTSTYVVSSVGGYRVLAFPISSTLTPGRYWMAVAMSSVSANAQGIINCSVAQQTHGSNIAYMPFATASKASNASWPQAFAGRGVYSATSGAFPATVALSTDHIRALATTVVLPFWNVSGYTTVTNML